MNRKIFLAGVALTPFLLQDLLKDKTAGQKRKRVLVGLGWSGQQLIKAFQERGFTGEQKELQVYQPPQVSTGRFVSPFSKEEVKVSPSFIRESIADANTEYIVVAGLGGSKSTPLAMSFYKEALQLDRRFRMLLTHPFAFEGKRRSARAAAFAELAGADPRVQILRLEELIDVKKNHSLSAVFKQHIPHALYKEFQKLINA